MNTSLSNENFGLVIAYILPGFVALWGVSYFSPTVESWITASQQGAPSVAGFMYVTLASIGTGLTVSGVRWLVIDTIHHLTGLTRPAWKFVNLDDKLQGFLTLNEGHYRYYQFYANMFIAVGFTYAAWLVWNGKGLWAAGWVNLYFVVLETVLFANSRDTLAKYYTRVAQLLGTLSSNPKKGACRMSNGIGKHHAKTDPATKPVVRQPAPAVKPTSPRAEQTQGR
ncbi:MAG: hypothetical protein WCB27_21325 [Thermoguttaceae bacterium]